jgi:hypothetical protein
MLTVNVRQLLRMPFATLKDGFLGNACLENRALTQGSFSPLPPKSAGPVSAPFETGPIASVCKVCFPGRKFICSLISDCIA